MSSLNKIEKEDSMKLKVIYHNDLNKISFTKFNSIQIDLLMYLLTKIKNKETEQVTLSFNEIKTIINYKKDNYKQLYIDLRNMNEKIQSTFYSNEITVDGNRKFSSYILFPTYILDEAKKTLTVGTNKDFLYLVNDFNSNFTKFDLSELVDLKSIYSKNMYRLLSQYKDKGKRFFKIEDFKNLLDVPESYRMSDINKRVLEPILNELAYYFEDLRIEKLPLNKKGVPITNINFYFKPVQIEERSYSKTFEVDEKKLNTLKDIIKDLKDEEIKELLRLTKNDETIIIDKYFETQKSIAMGNKIKDMESYLSALINTEYKGNEKDKEEVQIERQKLNENISYLQKIIFDEDEINYNDCKTLLELTDGDIRQIDISYKRAKIYRKKKVIISIVGFLINDIKVLL